MVKLPLRPPFQPCSPPTPCPVLAFQSPARSEVPQARLFYRLSPLQAPELTAPPILLTWAPFLHPLSSQNVRKSFTGGVFFPFSSIM